MTLPPPGPPALDPGDPRTRLAHRVTEAVLALPGYFGSTTNIEGLAATDLFALNTVLGATTEVQVVETLNRMRDVGDPDNEWPTHRFDRQAQTFPDVLLRRRTGAGEYDVAMGRAQGLVCPREGGRAQLPLPGDSGGLYGVGTCWGPVSLRGVSRRTSRGRGGTAVGASSLRPRTRTKNPPRDETDIR